ncbi:MAG: hypothetical protein ACRD01_05530 [Terriglobales bacterium]
MAAIEAEIEALLRQHAGEAVDYVAIFMLLNTVAGGHYEDRYGEDELRRQLAELLTQGRIRAWHGLQQLDAATVKPGETSCTFALNTA